MSAHHGGNIKEAVANIAVAILAVVVLAANPGAVGGRDA